ncbi:hypothetical protein [Pengzhenrongella sicca]|uniref:Conjugal transfer protein TrbL n=1 Tax=Pengzhenrongella sicca TaxID=2819238 RepID=A0A8A4ZFI4_9MICO|nr:hypothetical protein [Pengzhenrongella sicca]QTE30055.1 hypothetical protein J4E96_03250 [Pengzhenrongella sicca]
MPVPTFDPCAGLLNTACEVAAGVTGSVNSAASDYVLGGLGQAFVDAAQSVATMGLASLDTTTAIDLTASWFRANVAVIAAITLPVVVGLFVIQVVTSVLHREPGGLVRAVVGVAKALLGAALALAVTQVALTAVDGICGFIARSAGMTVSAAAGMFFDFARLVSGPSPVLQMLLGLALIVGFLMLWGVMLFRKAALILIAVFAPIAFAGSAWDQTRVWTRRWLEIVAALVFCKVVIVVVFVVGASAFSGIGPTTAGAPATGNPDPGGLSDVLVGLLLLSIAAFAPWLTWRFVHWSGMEAAAVMNSAVASNPITTGARRAGAQTKQVAQSALTSMVVGGVTGVGASAAARASAASGSSQRPKTAPRPTAAATQPGGGEQS